MNNQAAEILALLDLHFDPEPGRRYPTIDDYTEALDRLRREEAALLAHTPADPRPQPTRDELLRNVLSAPSPARTVLLDQQAGYQKLYAAALHGRRATITSQQPSDFWTQPLWRIGIVRHGSIVPIEGQTFASLELAQGACALFQSRQPTQNFVTINP